MSEYKVVFHIDEISKWKLLLNNAANLLEALGDEKIYIEVVANSEAVKYYDSNQNLHIADNKMEYLNKKGVKFIACNNALTAYEIKKHNIFQFVDIVPAGVVELVRRQSEGFAYIKP